MVCVSSFYGVEETPILGFLSSSKCWGDRKSIPLSEQTLSPSPSLPREDTVNGKMQTRMDKKDPWSSASIFSFPNGAQCDSGESSFPVKSWWPRPTQSTVFQSLCQVASSSGTGTLQTISQFYKHLCRLTSYTPFIYFNKHREEHCCCSVTQSCPTLYDPIDYSMPGFPVLHCLPELAQTHSIQRVMPSNRLILCRPPPASFFCLQSFPASGSFAMSWLFAT